MFSSSCSLLTSSAECIGYQNGPDAYSPRANDVWSLGIIFTSMISGHNPWKRAVMTDNCFRAFIRDPNFLRSMLPISKAASNILQRIFVSPGRRITLPRLRQLVLDADTLFMSDAEITSASVYVQWAAASYMGVHPSSSGDDSMSSVDLVSPAAEAEKQAAGVSEKKVGAKSMPTAVKAHIVPLPQSRSQPTSLTGEAVSDIESHAHRSPMRKAPTPQPMPSPGELLNTSRESSPSSTRTKKKWRPDSPFGFFRRIVDKIYS